MTLPYEDNPMPHVLAVQCPECRQEAVFDFAECVKIRLRKDLGYFQKSKFFDCKKVTDYYGVGVNLACYYHKLTQNSLPNISDLPDGYSMSDWEHSNYIYRAYGFDAGTIVCRNCGLRRKHGLSWPSDAYFQIEYRRHILWAFNRESAVELLDFVRSKDRDRSKYKYRSFLLKMPPEFLAKNARDEVTKRLSARLGMKA